MHTAAAVTRLYLSKNDDSMLSYAVGLVFLHELTKFEINYLHLFPGKIYILISCIDKLNSRKVKQEIMNLVSNFFFCIWIFIEEILYGRCCHCGKK